MVEVKEDLGQIVMEHKINPELIENQVLKYVVKEIVTNHDYRVCPGFGLSGSGGDHKNALIEE